MNSVVINLLIGLLVLIYVISRQLVERPVKEEKGFRLPIILVIVGVIQVLETWQTNQNSFSGIAIILLLVGLLSGAFFGLLRAEKIHVWYDKNQLMTKGNWITVILWVIGVGIHLGLEFASGQLTPGSSGVADSSLLLYLAISIGVQKYVTLERAKIIRMNHHTAP